MHATRRPEAGRTRPAHAARQFARCSRGSAVAGVATVAMAVLVGACGGGGSAAATATTTTTLTRAARNQAYIRCLQSHGVNVTGLGGIRGGPNASTTLPPGVTQQQLTAAMQACQSLRPTGGGGNFQNSPAFAAYRNCINLQLQKAGATTLPPPGQGGGGGFGGGQPPPSGVTTTTNPVVQAARQACIALLPAGGAGGPGGGGGADAGTTTPTT